MDLKKLFGERGYRYTRFLAMGLSNPDIAKVCGTTEHVVKNVLRVCYDVSGMSNRVELALFFIRHDYYGHPEFDRRHREAA